MDQPLTLLEMITESLELLLVPFLGIELFLLWRIKALKWSQRTKEMVTNVLAIVVTYTGVFLAYPLWERLFESMETVLPYSVPTNVVTIVAAIFIADFVYYWEHRLEHEKRGLWALWHSVHHSSPEYDVTTSMRLGFFDGLLTLFFHLPLILLGFEPIVAIAANAFVISYQTWIHTELIQKMPRWFEAIFNTPSHHRAHHGADEIYLDKNYGAVLIVWDRIFGTFQEERFRPTYGLTKQIESSHPLDVQLSELRDLLADLKADTSWGMRWRRIWNRPGWQRESIGDHNPQLVSRGSN